MLSCLLGAACAEAPAVRSRWNIQPRTNVVHTAVEAIHGRLTEGKVWIWYTDNDLAFEGPKVKEVGAKLVGEHHRGPAGDANKNTNPVAERSIGTIRQMILAMCAFPRQYGYDAAPECLWSWAAQQAELLVYFLNTAAHNPPTSPYRFSHPDAPPADMSWAYPMF